jgi:RecJ-like exonuclease
MNVGVRITTKGLRYLFDKCKEEDPCPMCSGGGIVGKGEACGYCLGEGRISAGRAEAERQRLARVIEAREKDE